MVERVKLLKPDDRGSVSIYPDADALARAAAELVAVLAEEAIAARGRFAVALAGGSTPRTTYALLATEEFASRLDWPRIHIFWGDERCVPPDRLDSNYFQARQALLDRVPVLASNIHRIPCEREPTHAAIVYERTLQAFFTPHAPGRISRFDLVILGMGPDGHTASLFPGTAALREQKRWVVAQYIECLAAWRVTLTPLVINSAAHVVFLVSGADKAERLQEVLAGPRQPDRLPAQIVRLSDGQLLWLVDAAAAVSARGGVISLAGGEGCDD